jgi:hypothetical protein
MSDDWRSYSAATVLHVAPRKALAGFYICIIILFCTYILLLEAMIEP